MVQTVSWFALAIGFIQGFVGFTVCISLIPVFAQLIIGMSEASKFATIITKIIAFIFIALVFFSVGGYWLDAFTEDHIYRKELGSYWRVGLFLGFVAWALIVGKQKRTKSGLGSNRNQG